MGAVGDCFDDLDDEAEPGYTNPIDMANLAATLKLTAGGQKQVFLQFASNVMKQYIMTFLKSRDFWRKTVTRHNLKIHLPATYISVVFKLLYNVLNERSF